MCTVNLVLCVNIVMSDDNKMRANIALRERARDVCVVHANCMYENRIEVAALLDFYTSETFMVPKFFRILYILYDNEEKCTIKKMLFLKGPIFVW